MARLKRYKADHETKPLWVIEKRLTDDPSISAEEEGQVEIVDCAEEDSLDDLKPQSQKTAEAADQVQQAKDQAVALLSQASGQPINMLQRWFAKATVYFLNEIAAGNIEGVTEEQFLAKVLEQQNALSGSGMLIQGGK